MTVRKPSLLLVDDHDVVRIGTRSLLESEFEVIGEADDVEAAIDLAEERLPDVVLLDVRLPGGGGAVVAESNHVEFNRIKTVADLDRELAAASAAGKSAILDFYADWCVSCIEMEEYTFTDPGVQDALSNTVLLQADVTANDDEDKELLQRFGVFGPPTIIFFGTDGQQRHGFEVVGYMKAKAFEEHVTKAFADVI